MAGKQDIFEGLPTNAADYIRLVVRKVKYSRKVRRDVQAELINHFQEALRDCTDDKERETIALAVISQFGDAKLLGKLIRRGKKRCRPLWKKAIIRSFQTAGLIILAVVLVTVSMNFGSPTISVDYLSELNKIARPMVAEEDNAWIHLSKVIELYVDLPSKTYETPDEQQSTSRTSPSQRGVLLDDEPLTLKTVAHNYWKSKSDRSSLTPEQWASIESWLADNEPTWEHFVAASNKKHYWLEYSLTEEDGWLIDMSLPELNKIRHTSLVGIWKSVIALNNGQTDQAIEHCLTIAKASALMQKAKGTLIEQLVGMAIANRAARQMLNIIIEGDLTGEQLARVQKQRLELYGQSYPLVDVETEKLYFMDTVQRCYTKGGPGGGHLIPRQLEALLSNIESGDDWQRTLIPAACLLFAGRDETESTGILFYTRTAEIVKLSPYQQRKQGLRDWPGEFTVGISQVRHPLPAIMIPSLTLAGDFAYLSKANHEALMTVLALKRYRLDEGEYPETLQELVDADYMTALPDDPYAEGPLKYERRGDDFILYSFGEDFEDSGGHYDRRKRWGGKTTQHMPGVDHIFWPPQE